MKNKNAQKIIIGEITQESGARMRNNKPNKKLVYDNGYFQLPLKNKYIGQYRPIYRSSLERKFMIWCERCAKVVSWDSEPFAVGYKRGNEIKGYKQGNYYIDFVVNTDNDERWLVEVKPLSQTIKGSRDFETNKMKWTAMISYANNSRSKFLIITEHFKPFKGID